MSANRVEKCTTCSEIEVPAVMPGFEPIRTQSTWCGYQLGTYQIFFFPLVRTAVDVLVTTHVRRVVPTHHDKEQHETLRIPGAYYQRFKVQNVVL